MYRYREKTTYNGKTCLISGNTRRSLKVLKHVKKVGKPLYVKGYFYRAPDGSIHNAVMLVGDKGTVRFSGFSWGYSGEGSRGLNELFRVLGLSHLDATDRNHMGAWPDWTLEHVKEHWRIKL
jgi:hypothetical protein